MWSCGGSTCDSGLAAGRWSSILAAASRCSRAAAEGNLARPHAIERYDPSYIGDDLTVPGAPPLYNPANPNHEIVRTHLIDPDGRDPDDPLLDYFALLALL